MTIGQTLCRLGFHADRPAYRFRDSRLIVACVRCGRYRIKEA